MTEPLTKNEKALLQVLVATTEAMAAVSELLLTTSNSLTAQIVTLREFIGQLWVCPSPFAHEPHEVFVGEGRFLKCIGRAERDERI